MGSHPSKSTPADLGAPAPADLPPLNDEKAVKHVGGDTDDFTDSDPPPKTTRCATGPSKEEAQTATLTFKWTDFAACRSFSAELSNDGQMSISRHLSCGMEHICKPTCKNISQSGSRALTAAQLTRLKAAVIDCQFFTLNKEAKYHRWHRMSRDPPTSGSLEVTLGSYHRAMRAQGDFHRDPLVPLFPAEVHPLIELIQEQAKAVELHDFK